MDTLNSDSIWVVFSIRLYRLLLLIYPSGFRQEYGPWMLQVFGDHARAQQRRGGLPGLSAWWGRTMLDTLATAIEEHAQRGVDMSKQKFVKLSGWGMALGGLAVMLGWLAGTRPEYNPYNFLSRWYDRYLNWLEVPLIVLGLWLISAGMVGLWARYGQAAGAAGRSFLVIGALCGLVSGLGALSLPIYDGELTWSMFFFGMVFQFLCLALFGWVCLRSQILPRWNALPLLAGIWVPLFTLASLAYETTTGRWLDPPDLVLVAIWLLSLAGLAGLGYLLQGDTRAGLSDPKAV